MAGGPGSRLFGQLPPGRLGPGPVLHQVGVNCVGPVVIGSGLPRGLFVAGTCVCVFVSFTVKAVHLGPVLELTVAAFVATLWGFMPWRGKPFVIRCHHGTNFIGAAKEIKELYSLLRNDETNGQIADFCSTQNIQCALCTGTRPSFWRLVGGCS